MSKELILDETKFKVEVSKILNLLNDLQTNFKDLESVLESLNSSKQDFSYLFNEFVRHGQEFINYFTNEKITELYE